MLIRGVTGLNKFRDHIIVTVCLLLIGVGFIICKITEEFEVFSLDPTFIANLIAFFGVFIAVYTLYLQSKATQQQLKLQNYIEYTKRYQEIVLNFPEDINRSDFNIASLEQCKFDKTMRYMRAYYDLCFEEFDLYSKGFIDGDMWNTWDGGMKYAFSKTAFKQAWKQIEQDTRYNYAFNQMVKEAQKVRQ